jgi:hypothetical protein
LAAYRKELVVLRLQQQGASRFRVESQRVIKGRLFISLEKLDKPVLQAQDTLIVFDTSDGMLMGSFEITEVRRNAYIAQGVSDIDELWLGEAMQTGPTDIVPNMEAIYFPEREEND